MLLLSFCSCAPIFVIFIKRCHHSLTGEAFTLSLDTDVISQIGHHVDEKLRSTTPFQKEATAVNTPSAIPCDVHTFVAMETDNVEGGQILPRDRSTADVDNPSCEVANDIVVDATHAGTDEQEGRNRLDTIPEASLSNTHGIDVQPKTPVQETNCDVPFLTIDSEALDLLRSYDSASPSPAKVTPKSRPRRKAARGRTRSGIQTRALRNLRSKTQSCEINTEVQTGVTVATVHASNEIVAPEDSPCTEHVVVSKDATTRNSDVDAVSKPSHSNADIAAITSTLPDVKPEPCRKPITPLRHSVLSRKSWQAKIQNGHWTMVNERKEKRKYLGVPNKCLSSANAAFLEVAPPAREPAQWQCLPCNGLTLPMSWHRQAIGDDSVGTFSARQVTTVGSYPAVGKNSAHGTNTVVGFNKVNKISSVCRPLNMVGDEHEPTLLSSEVLPGMDSDVGHLPLERSDVEKTVTKVAKNTTVTRSLAKDVSCIVETSTALDGTSAKSKVASALDGTSANSKVASTLDGTSAKSKVASKLDGTSAKSKVASAVDGNGTKSKVASTLHGTSAKSKVSSAVDGISTNTIVTTTVPGIGTKCTVVSTLDSTSVKSKVVSTIESISARCKLVASKQIETKINTIEMSPKKKNNNNVSQVACNSPDANGHVRTLNFDVGTPHRKTANTASDRVQKPPTVSIPKAKMLPRVLDCLSPEQREAIHQLSNGTSSHARDMRVNVNHVAVNATSSHEHLSSTSVNSCNKQSTNLRQEQRSFRSVTSKTCFVTTTTGDSSRNCDQRNDETSVQTTGSVARQEGVPSTTLRRPPRRVAMKTIKQGDEMLAERTLARNAAQAALFARHNYGARTNRNVKNVPKKKTAAKCGAAPCSVVTSGIVTTESESEVAVTLVAFATSVVISPAKDAAGDDCIRTNLCSPKSTLCDSDHRTDGVTEAPKCSTPHGHPPLLASTASPVSMTRKAGVTMVRRTPSPDGVSQGMMPPCTTPGRGKRKLESQQSVKVKSTCLYTPMLCFHNNFKC